jgi:hypothetical protein
MVGDGGPGDMAATAPHAAPAPAWSWTREPSPSLSRLAAVWASGPGDVWATPRVQHSHGDGQWMLQTWTDVAYAPVDVSGPDDVYVATIEPSRGGNGSSLIAGDHWTAPPPFITQQPCPRRACRPDLEVASACCGAIFAIRIRCVTSSATAIR